MAMNSITLIKQAEDDVNSLIQKAQRDANEIIRNAETRAKEVYNETLKIARDKSEEILFRAEADGQKKAQPIIDGGSKEVEHIQNIQRSKFDEAVSLVVERIVKNGDN